MAQAEIREVLNVDKDKLFETIQKYEDYPGFVEGCSQAQVLSREGGKTRVSYKINVMRECSYTLDHIAIPEKNRLEWSMVESDTFKRNIGFWELKSLGAGKTEAFYKIELEFKIMVPSMILNRLVKGSLPPMIKSFEAQAKKNGG